MYNINSLKDGIEQAKKNIIIFEEAIRKEGETIEEYRGMISHLEQEKKLAEIKEQLEGK